MSASVFIATSLDGFIAREDGALDWLPVPDSAPDGEDYGYREFIAGVDAIVMGRSTFDVVLGFGGEWPYPKPVVVLTSRPLDLPEALAGRVETMGGEPAEIVARLAERGWEHLYVDGGVTIQRFLAAGLIERMIITRVPVLIGQGIPLFGPLERDIALRHVATRAFPDGLVSSEYVVER